MALAADDADVARTIGGVLERLRPHAKSKEARAFIAAASRLQDALAAPRPAPLLDSGARTDVLLAVRDAKDVAARLVAAPRNALLDDRRTARLFRASRSALRTPDRRALDSAAKRIEATTQVALYKARLQAPDRLMEPVFNEDSPSGTSNTAPPRRPWEFSLVKSPITPLSARDLDRAVHNALLPAMWRGARVSVRVLRTDRSRFYAEGDYLHALGEAPGIPRLLGGHWQSAAPASGRPSDDDVGFLVQEVVTGQSLDTFVRQKRLANALSQLRVLDRVVDALMHAQSVVPALSHQDLHPGNIFLVPTNPHSPHACILPMPVRPSSASLKNAHGAGKDAAHRDAAQSDEDDAIIDVQTDDDIDGEDDFELDDHVLPARFSSAHETDALPGSPVRSDATLDARVRTAACSAAARGDVALARGMLSMRSRVAAARAASISAGSAGSIPTSPESTPERPPRLSASASLTSAAVNPLRSKNAFLVQLLDFAPAAEARGRRARTSWGNSTVAGYCAPEMATPKMWKRAGDHQERIKMSALRERSKRSSSSSNNTSSAVVHTPAVPRPSSPRMVPRSMSYPRKAAADSAEGVMFGDDADFNAHCAPLAVAAVGRMHSLDSYRAEQQKGIVDEHHVDTGLPGSDLFQQFGKYRTEYDDYDDIKPAKNDIAQQKEQAIQRASRQNSHKRSDDGRLRRTGHDNRRIGHIYRRRSTHERTKDHPESAPNMPLRSMDDESQADSATGDARRESIEKRMHAVGKVDVWSIGWLVYYMATGKHPPSDVWASVRPLDLVDISGVSPQVVDIMKLCIVPDASRRSSLEGVKRRLDAHMREALFVKGLKMIEVNPRHAFPLLDRAVGIKIPRTSSHESDLRAVSNIRSMHESTITGNGTLIEPAGYHSDRDSANRYRTSSRHESTREKRPRTSRSTLRHKSSFSEAIADSRTQSIASTDRGSISRSQRGAVGTNGKTRTALAALPLVIVRRVEWEFAARKYERSTAELAKLRSALIGERWTKSEVLDGDLAVAYLKRRSAQGVISAQSALGWVYRWGAGNVPKDVPRAMRLWQSAMETGDPEAANGLGLVYHHGRKDIAVDGKKAQKYYQIAVEQGYPAAAVNLGVMLHDGAAGVEIDGMSAKALYELACENGDAIAANNLGLLLQHGAPGVEKDGTAAARAYELAILRGERNHARRNLGELLWEGMDDLRASIPHAIEQLALAIEEGDQPSRAAAQNKLRALISRDREAVLKSLNKGLRKKYGRVLLS